MFLAPNKSLTYKDTFVLCSFAKTQSLMRLSCKKIALLGLTAGCQKITHEDNNNNKIKEHAFNLLKILSVMTTMYVAEASEPADISTNTDEYKYSHAYFKCVYITHFDLTLRYQSTVNSQAFNDSMHSQSSPDFLDY